MNSVNILYSCQHFQTTRFESVEFLIFCLLIFSKEKPRHFFSLGRNFGLSHWQGGVLVWDRLRLISGVQSTDKYIIIINHNTDIVYNGLEEKGISSTALLGEPK